MMRRDDVSYFVRRSDVVGIPMEGHVSCPVLDASHGCVASFCSGITVHTATEYPATGLHDDQEGFVVLAGFGWARVGDEEFRLEPETCFLAPAGTPHSVRRDPESVPLAVCWFHGAIR
jgi:hypothetical protein